MPKFPSQALKLSLWTLLLGATAQATTIIYTTAPGATTTFTDPTSGATSTLAESAQVTFITSANTLEIRVMNFQIGSGSVQQTISGIDWKLDSTTTGGVITDFSGATINLNDPGGRSE